VSVRGLLVSVRGLLVSVRGLLVSVWGLLVSVRGLLVSVMGLLVSVIESTIADPYQSVRIGRGQSNPNRPYPTPNQPQSLAAARPYGFCPSLT